MMPCTAQVGAALNILTRCEHDAAIPAEVVALQHGLDAGPAVNFVLSCQKETGGFGKWGPGQGSADPLHTFFSLAGLQLMCDHQHHCYCCVPACAFKFYNSRQWLHDQKRIAQPFEPAFFTRRLLLLVHVMRCRGHKELPHPVSPELGMRKDRTGQRA